MNKFDTNGNYHLKFGSSGSGRGQLSGPVGVTTLIWFLLLKMVTIYISVFHTNGQFSHIIGKGELGQPCDVIVNTSNQLLVADWDHHCIYTFTLDGNYVSEFCSHGSGRGRLINPCSVTTDWYGFIVVAEYSNHRVSIFDKHDNFIRYFGSYGSDVGEFKNPRGIAISPYGNIYVSDHGNKRVQIFSTC